MKRAASLFALGAILISFAVPSSAYAQTSESGMGDGISDGTIHAGVGGGSNGGGSSGGGGGGSSSHGSSVYTYLNSATFTAEEIIAMGLCGVGGNAGACARSNFVRNYAANCPAGSGVGVSDMYRYLEFIRYVGWCTLNESPPPPPPTPEEIWVDLRSEAALLPAAMAPAPSPNSLIGKRIRVGANYQGAVTVGPLNNGLCSVAAAARPTTLIWRVRDENGNIIQTQETGPATNPPTSIYLNGLERRGRLSITVATTWEGRYNLICGGGTVGVPNFAGPDEIDLGTYTTPESAAAPVTVSEVRSLPQATN